MFLTYGHPFYLAITMGVTIHAMRVLNRHSLTLLSSLIAPIIITMLPLIPMSHASYMPFTISTITYRYEAVGGYASVVIALIVAILLLKIDDWNLLPIIGNHLKWTASKMLVSLDSGHVNATLIEYLENDYSLEEFLECFPSVTRELARQVLECTK